MIHRVDDRLRDEVRRYNLVFACPDCASFDPGGVGDDGGHGRCSLGYPVEPHRDPCLDGRDEVIFCKTFEAC